MGAIKVDVSDRLAPPGGTSSLRCKSAKLCNNFRSDGLNTACDNSLPSPFKNRLTFCAILPDPQSVTPGGVSTRRENKPCLTADHCGDCSPTIPLTRLATPTFRLFGLTPVDPYIKSATPFGIAAGVLPFPMIFSTTRPIGSFFPAENVLR